jgi:energy-coupling factor transporter ATP-binding protein EcfA2
MGVRETPAIEFRDFSFRYAGAPSAVLSNLSLRVDYGEFVLLSGDSGSGKSTLLASLIGSIPHIYGGESSGALFVCGREVSHERIAARARLIGSVLQDADSQIVHARVEDEIAFGCENLGVDPAEIETRVESAARSMRLRRELFTRTLSGGQKQRLITASTLAMDRKILLLDEPLANLDGEGAKFLLETLRELARKGCAVLLAEHRLDAVLPYADRRLHLVSGACEEERKKPQHKKPQHKRDGSFVSPAPGDAVLEVRNVSYRVAGREILRDLSFDVLRGERLVIFGENGCGKTTLLRVLARLAKPTTGEVTQRIAPSLGQKASPQWFKRVGYVYQNPNYQLFMPTVLEEIAYQAENEAEARRYAELFGLSELLGRHPHSLSEGQKRKLSVAAVCAMRPDVLLLDEPTVGQDGASLERMAKVIGSMNRERGVTIVTVTHDHRFAAAIADRTLHMKVRGPSG